MRSIAGKRNTYILITGSILFGVAIAAIVLMHHYWPFTENRVRADLASVASSNVHFGKFHRRYFPPRCVAEDVVFQQGNSGTPLMVIRRLTVESTFFGLLRHHVSLLRAEGLHGVLTLHGFNTLGNNVTIDRIVADGAVLDVPRQPSQAPTQFVVHKFFVTNLNDSGVMTFNAVFENPLPHGLLSISGQFGPWNQGDPAATSVSGKYSLERADLSVFHSIAGSVSSTGTFRGSFENIDAEGSTHSPALIVAKTGHSLPLDTHFKADVDATKGNVMLREIKARFGKDDITGVGSIARRSNGKRSAIIDLNCSRGRIEDTFYPFIHSPKSPLSGDVTFSMHVVISSGHERFLRKVKLTSNFKIQNAQFTRQETQTRLSQVSAPPNQEEAHELADFEGNVSLSQGVARFSQLSVHDEDAAASFRGNYDVTDQKVNLHGRLKTAASLSKTTNGIKAIFAKVIEPFFKERPHETVVPIHISGTYSHPNFGLDVGG